MVSLIERLRTDMGFRNAVLNAIGGAETEAMRGDCLSVILCIEFENHPDCPEDGELDHMDCWKQWAVDRTTEVLEQIAERLLSIPAIAGKK